MIDFEQNLLYLSIAEKALNAKYDDAKFITLLNGDEVDAITLFTRFCPFHCEMTVMAKYGTRKYLREVFSYPFLKLGYNRVNAFVRVDNQKSHFLCQRLGFKKEAYLQRWYGNADGIMYGMLKENCKWL